MSWQRYCATAEDTIAAGEAFAAVLRPSDIVLLSGTLGAGKTTFVQGVAKGLGAVSYTHLSPASGSSSTLRVSSSDVSPRSPLRYFEASTACTSPRTSTVVTTSLS